jgi:hypothetical protein
MQLITGFFQNLQTLKVELEGVEPSSKQGTHMVSTCLAGS